MSDLERDVARHYQASDLAARVLEALRAAGKDIGRLTPDDLAPVDEFHVGGRAATIHALEKLHLHKDQHVLDVGCGIGGAARYVAHTFGCRVTGIDLTPDFIAAARDLTARTGLADRIRYETASALAMPFEDATFDAGLTLHVAMNIKDRQGLYREVARVLRPGALFCIYDVMKGANEGLRFPMPWSQTPDTSHLTTPAEMETLLGDAGFEIIEREDRSAFGIAFFRQRLAAAAAGGPLPPGTHILMGPSTREKSSNLLAGLEQGCVIPMIMIARRGA